MLAERILVLNSSWRAINITTVKKALSLLYDGVAHAVNIETYETHDFYSWADLSLVKGENCVRTVRFSIKIPEIIKLNRYDGYPPQVVKFSRENIYKRDNFTCQYCGAKPGTHELSIDHIVPRSRGGRSTWNNCVLACVKCNKRKSNKLLREVGMRLRKKPHRPRGTKAIFFPVLRIKKSWENFVSEKHWNVELED